MDKLHLYFLTFGATLLFVKALNGVAPRIGLVDIPSGRKNHEGEIPLTGGIAMFLAIVSGAFLSGTPGHIRSALLPALALMVMMGACDDLFELSARCRFVVQTLAALLMVYAGKAVIADLGDLFGEGAVRPDALSVPFTVFCVIGVINAINMLDGIDGLAGGVVFVALLLFGYTALLSGNGDQAVLAFLAASAVLGFILFNMRSPWRSRAAVFMGDSGSMMLGFLVAWFAIDLTHRASPAFTPITAVWILAIPILDTVSLMIRRIGRGQSPFAPDREHLHHVLLRAGFTVRQAVFMIINLSLTTGLIGIGAYYAGVAEYLMFYGFMALSILYLMGISLWSRAQAGWVAAAEAAADPGSCASDERCSEETA